MARLTSKWEASVEVGGEEVLFVLREPTNKELNEFLGKRISFKGNKVEDSSVKLRAELFDKLLMEVKNLEDEEGNPITTERKELIPLHWKSDIIFRKFEQFEANIKN